MNKPFLTILTPTYNRAELLTECYGSLLRQTDRDFEWLIVDDGSTDGTKDFVRKAVEKGGIPIRYLYKDNGGKHTAVNAGVAAVESEFTMILDSDDTLTQNAVETVRSYARKYGGRAGLCALAFLKIGPDGRSLAKDLPEAEFISDYMECRINRGIRGDMAEVFLTRCLREFPFPEFPGETFLSEDAAWIPMGVKYRMVFIDRPICRAAYREDGLTASGRAMRLKSPLGGMERAKMLMSGRCGFLCRAKGMLLYLCNGKFAGKSVRFLYRDCGHPLLFLLYLPCGLALHRVWKIRYFGRRGKRRS